MDKNYPKNIDPRPNRRHSKDNPYEIFTVGIETDTPHYLYGWHRNRHASLLCVIHRRTRC